LQPCLLLHLFRWVLLPGLQRAGMWLAEQAPQPATWMVAVRCCAAGFHWAM
jgi:hypothetical protein